MPTVLASGGPGGGPAYVFVRESAQFLNAGLRTFNLVSQGGFTAVGMVMFTGAMTGSTSDWENVFDFGNGGVGLQANNIVLSRHAGTQNLNFEIRSGTNVCKIADTVAFVQNQWTKFVVLYDHSTREVRCRVNNAATFSTTICANGIVTDRTVTHTNIGSDVLGSAARLQGRVAGLFAVDQVLSHSEIAGLFARMSAGDDTIQPCATCPAGTTSSPDSMGPNSCVLPCAHGFMRGGPTENFPRIFPGQ